MFGLVLAFALSGYLLPWDQKGYWAKLVEATITGTRRSWAAPKRLLQGGNAYGNPDPDAAYALHAYALPGAILGLLGFHIYLFRRHGYTPRWTSRGRSRSRRRSRSGPTSCSGRRGVRGGVHRRGLPGRALARRGARGARRSDVELSWRAPSGTCCRCSSC